MGAWARACASRATTATALHAIEVEDTALALLEFESGAVATFEATTAGLSGYKRRVEFTGTEGTLVLEHDRLVQADLRQPADDLLASAAAGQQPERHHRHRLGRPRHTSA